MTPPDFTRNFLPMPRDVLRELWARPVDLAVYAVLCDRAAWSAGPREIKGRMVDLDVGQCVCGRPDLALATGASDRAIRTALTRLQSDQLIELAPSKLGTTVTICGLKESREAREAERPTLADETVQRCDQPDPAGASNAATSIKIRKIPDQTLPLARAIPGSTDAAPDAAAHPMPSDWTPAETEANQDLAAEATAAGVDQAVELRTLRDWSIGKVELDWDARWRVWLTRAIRHAAEHRTGKPKSVSVGRFEPLQPSEYRRSVPRPAARAARPLASAYHAPRAADPAPAAQPVPSAEDRSRMLREVIAAVCPTVVDDDATQQEAS